MLTIIKNWMFLRYLSKRYDFGVKYLFNDDSAYWTYNTYTNKTTIGICIWGTMFNETLLHELGHLYDFRREGKCDYSVYLPMKNSLSQNNLQNYMLSSNGASAIMKYLDRSGIPTYADCIVMEGKASRFAMKALRSTGKVKKGSYHYLAKCLQSYLQYSCKKDIADVSYMMLKYITVKINNHTFYSNDKKR